MKKTFILRVDLESEKGIKEGLPKLLDLLKKYKIKASFYLTMGGESTILELLKYRKKLISSSERKIKVWSLKEKVRMALFPKDFVRDNIPLLKIILDDGHELGLHGWKHRAWTRGLNEINIEKHVAFAVRKYQDVFKRNPISFCSPGFNTNEKVLRILEKYGIKFISDFKGDSIQKYGTIKNVPITITGEGRTPIIESLVSLGKSDIEILEEMKKIGQKGKIFSFYIHDLFEARFKIPLLEQIFKYVKESEMLNKKIIDC